MESMKTAKTYYANTRDGQVPVLEKRLEQTEYTYVRNQGILGRVYVRKKEEFIYQ